MPKLIIQADDDKASVLVSVQIKAIDPAKATIAILKALAEMEEPKKTRADKGKRREPKLNLPLAAKVTPADPVLT